MRNCAKEIVKSYQIKLNFRKAVCMYWDIIENKNVVKITPSIFYLREPRLLEFGWLYWSFVIQLD